MASPDNQQHWLPFEINKDCSQGLCSKYCPQWCYTIYTPSPPFGYPDQESDSNFSPLVIAIIGILASAFLLVSYYTIAAKYCGNFGAWRNRIHRNPDEILEENRSSVQNEQWHIVTTGLEEALIKSIAVCKYKKGDGLIEGTDCSVCLSEFQEGESLRLLPKCSHAFHLPCIDTWLQSHSNCPLCRANIVSATMVPQLPAPEEFSGDESSPENRIVVNGLSSLDEETGVVDLGENRELEEACGSKVGNFRALSDLGVSDADVIIEINDEVQPIRRSVSMDFSCRSRVSIADILASDDFPAKVNSIPAWVKPFEGEQSKGKEAYANRVLRSVKAPMAMKRSFSSGRFLFTRHGRGKSAVLPV